MSKHIRSPVEPNTTTIQQQQNSVAAEDVGDVLGGKIRPFGHECGGNSVGERGESVESRSVVWWVTLCVTAIVEEESRTCGEKSLMVDSCVRLGENFIGWRKNWVVYRVWAPGLDDPGHPSHRPPTPYPAVVDDRLPVAALVDTASASFAFIDSDAARCDNTASYCLPPLQSVPRMPACQQCRHRPGNITATPRRRPTFALTSAAFATVSTACY
ncbi:hypothetical protein ACLOJK_004266, partial [Asimina triloba]